MFAFLHACHAPKLQDSMTFASNYPIIILQGVFKTAPFNIDTLMSETQDVPTRVISARQGVDRRAEVGGIRSSKVTSTTPSTGRSMDVPTRRLQLRCTDVFQEGAGLHVRPAQTLFEKDMYSDSIRSMLNGTGGM